MTPRRAKPDLEILQGTWNVAALEMDGQKMPAAMLGAARIVVDGDRFQSLGMGAVYEGKLKLDPTANPKTFDLAFTVGPESGNTALGIYSLDGDEWRICLTTRGGDRPHEFAAAAGTGHALETLTRGKAVAQIERPEAAPTGAPTELEGEWTMVSGSMDAHPIEPSMLKSGRRVTRGNQTKVLFGQQVFIDATFTLDPAKTPREIDYVHAQGMNAGKTQLGIYELDGKTLKLSSSTPGQPRPVDFEPGSGTTVVVWALAKK
jgi:uncharacterized protein (TIGR03067 family)